LASKFGFKLIDAAAPAELFIELMKYREGGETTGNSREHDFLAYVIRHYNESKSQRFHDLFVLFLTQGKRNGYFVEFGATNGVMFTNTYLLETDFGWSGILAEPAHGWHNELYKNRKCTIETRCVWNKSGEHLEFNEVPERGLSIIDAYSESDGNSATRKQGDKCTVETISLNDLLKINGAPRRIDYLSIDTEGSELAILSHFYFLNMTFASLPSNITSLPRGERYTL
jgi:FkbM family methyltransferase